MKTPHAIVLTMCLVTFVNCWSNGSNRSVRNAQICEIIKAFSNLTCEIRDEEMFIEDGVYLKILRNSENVLKIKCFHNHTIMLNKFPFVDLSDVKVLEIKGCSMKNRTILSNFKARLNLKSVSKLTLYIDTESKKDISHELFKDFQNVESLRLYTARKDTFYEDSFSALTNLKNLTLSVYDLITLPSNLFVKSSSLEELAIVSTAEGAGLKVKNHTLTFRVCKFLEKITISGIRWPIELTLKLDESLEEINVFNNKHIVNLTIEYLRPDEKVEILNLSNNLMKTLHPHVLEKLKILDVIDLSNNQFEKIGITFFKHNTFLTRINLADNIITFIEKDAFSNQKMLQELNLNGNKLIEVNMKSFFGMNLIPLEHLLLSSNSITRITGEIPKGNSLKKIDLSNNKLSKFFVEEFWPKSSFNLTVLLENNGFDSIDFSDLDGLESEPENHITIDLGRTPMICNCYTVSLLKFLTKNQSENFPEYIYRKVKVLPSNPKCDKISKYSPKYVRSIIPYEAVCPLDSIHSKVCDDSKCKCMKRTADSTLVIECTNIETVPVLPQYKQLSGNSINKIDLLLSKNIIKNLPTTSDVHYNDVVKIDAAHNNIRYIKENNIPDRLEYLDLKDNELTFITPKVLSRLSKLKTIYLSRNFWNCSSPYASDLIKFVKTNRNIVKDFESIRCSNNKNFLEFEDEGFCNVHIFTTTIVTLAGIMVIICIFLYYRNRAEISEWIFVNDSCHLVEKVFDFFKPLDVCIVCTKFDKIFGNYIGSTLIKKPNSFKCTLLIKSWNSDEKIPQKELSIFRKSRRVVIILSEYFNEKDWKQWCYANISSRIIFITKGCIQTDDIKIKNKMTVKFNDPLFWDKLKHSLVNREEISFDSVDDEEMIFLNEV